MWVYYLEKSAMIGSGRMNDRISLCPPPGPGSIPGHGEVFQGIFPCPIKICQSVLSQHGRTRLNIPLNGTTPPMTIEEEGPRSATDR